MGWYYGHAWGNFRFPLSTNENFFLTRLLKTFGATNSLPLTLYGQYDKTLEKTTAIYSNKVISETWLFTKRFQEFYDLHAVVYQRYVAIRNGEKSEWRRKKKTEG